jgi:hypothetical protein
MAEPTPAPALPSTADTVPYVPVSWMAVAAIGVSCVFVGILVALGVSAFLAKKPLIQPELLVFPVLGIVLSFAARRLIRNSEGTRTGENLANTAWWISLIAGLGYAAYLLAIDFAIRRDARATLDRWIEKVKAADDESINAAFLWTREPSQRGQISPKDTDQILGRFREEYVGFKQSDLILVARRNRGECEIVPEGVKDWMYRAGGIDCAFTGTLKCPEGRFPFLVGLRGIEATGGESGGRQWWVIHAPNGYIQRDKLRLTPYGWMMSELENSGMSFATQFFLSLRSGPPAIPYAFQAMMRPDPKWPYRVWQTLAVTVPGRVAVGGGLTAATPYTPEFVSYSFPNQFYRALGGGEPTAEQRAQFKINWETSGLLPAGGRLRNNPDTHPMVVVAGSAIEVHVPCELPFPGEEATAAARARLVVACTDPDVVRELSQLRSEANPETATSVPPSGMGQRDFKWRLVRLESDMVKVQLLQRAGPDGARP